MLAATEDYRVASDTLADFFDDCCITDDPTACVHASRLYVAYTDWCKRNGHDPDNSTVFGCKLTERGFPPEKSGTVIRRGISLLAVPNSDTSDF